MADVNKRPVGRPQGAPTTIINLRIPLDLLERLDRFVDFAEQRRGVSVNRAIVMREALTAWLQAKDFYSNATKDFRVLKCVGSMSER